jgi:hypothetical protein
MKSVAYLCYYLKITPRQLYEEYNDILLSETLDIIKEEQWQQQMK